jgi:8-oxo-dGTP diphosphatase
MQPVPPRERDPEVARAFGLACRLARERLDFTQEEVAAAARIQRVTLGRIEQGKREPSLSVLHRIARALGMTGSALLAAAEAEARGPSVEEVREGLRAMARAAAKLSVAACYVVRGGNLLMVQRRFKQGTLEWAGPSGNIRKGETPEAAAARETLEETGVSIESIRILGDRVHPATDRHLIYLACRYLSGEAAVRDHEEIVAVEWVPIPEALARWDGLVGGVFPPVRAYLEAEWAVFRAPADNSGAPA